MQRKSFESFQCCGAVVAKAIPDTPRIISVEVSSIARYSSKMDELRNKDVERETSSSKNWNLRISRKSCLLYF